MLGVALYRRLVFQALSTWKDPCLVMSRNICWCSFDTGECWLIVSMSANFDIIRLRKVQRLSRASLKVVLQRIGRANVLPFIHVTPGFMQYIFKAIYSSCTTSISWKPPYSLLARAKPPQHSYSPPSLLFASVSCSQVL